MTERQVVPHVGTWIEIWNSSEISLQIEVVPHVGTWIEIIMNVANIPNNTSFPTWERGLK